MQYANGISTNQMVFQTACRLMHSHGYKNTTYAMIAQEANIPVGLVSYHYKKQDLITRIYSDYILSIRKFIAKKAGKLIDNQLQAHILMSHIMLTQIFSDSPTLAFHLEVEERSLVPLEVHDLVRNHQIEILRYFNVKITPEYYYWCATAEYGARRELIRQNQSISPESPEFRQLLNLLSTITVRTAGLNGEIIEENLRKSNEIFETLDYHHIRMFPE